MKAIETWKVDVATIHHNEASRLRDDVIQDLRIAEMRACHMDQRGNSALNIEQRIQFHGSSGAFVRRPGKQGQADIDD